MHVWPLVTIEILYIVYIVPYDVFDANFGTVDQNRATTTLRAKVGRMCFMPLFPFMLISAYCHPNSNLNPNVNLNGRWQCTVTAINNSMQQQQLFCHNWYKWERANYSIWPHLPNLTHTPILNSNI